MTWIWMTPSMWRKELSEQWDTCCKTKAPKPIMLYVLLYKVLKSYWLGFLLSTNGIHTPFLSSNPRVLGFIVNGEHTETVSKQRYCQNPFRRYSRTSVDLCQSSGGYTRTHTHKAVIKSPSGSPPQMPDICDTLYNESLEKHKTA